MGWDEAAKCPIAFDQLFLSPDKSDGMEGEFGEPRAVASTNGKATKIDRRVRTKTVVPLEGVGTSLTAASSELMAV